MIQILEDVNSNDFFILSIFPVIGLVLSVWMKKETRLKILYVSGALFLMLFTGYILLANWFYTFCFLLVLSALISFPMQRLTWERQNKILIVFVSTLLFLLSSFAFMVFESFDGFHETDYVVRNGDYRIEAVNYSAFSGRSVTVYRLYHAPLFGLLKKELESVRTDPFSDPKCLYLFEKENVQFDHCSNILTVL